MVNNAEDRKVSFFFLTYNLTQSIKKVEESKRIRQPKTWLLAFLFYFRNWFYFVSSLNHDFQYNVYLFCKIKNVKYWHECLGACIHRHHFSMCNNSPDFFVRRKNIFNQIICNDMKWKFWIFLSINFWVPPLIWWDPVVPTRNIQKSKNIWAFKCPIIEKKLILSKKLFSDG